MEGGPVGGACSASGSPMSLDQVFADLARTGWLTVGHTFCRLSVVDHATGDVEVKATCTARPAFWQERLFANPLELRPLPATVRLLVNTPNGGNELTALSARLRLEKPLQSLLVVPIWRDGRPLGLLDLGELRAPDRSAFDDASIGVARALAEQFALVLDLAESGSPEAVESAAAIARQTHRLCDALNRSRLYAKLEVALAGVRPTKEPGNQCHAVARIGAELLDCRNAAFLTHHPVQRVLEVDATWGLPAELVGRTVGLDWGFEGLVSGRAVPQVLDEADLDARGWAALSPLAGRVLGVPLRRNGHVEQVLFLGGSRNRPFGALELEVSERFAAHAAVALDASRLLSAEQRKVKPLQVLQRIGDYIQSTADEEKILHAVLTGITAGYGLGFNRAALFLLEHDGRHLVGRLGVGHLDPVEARIGWQKNPQNSIADFERYLEALEAGRIRPGPVTERVRDLLLRVDPQGTDLLSRAIRERACKHRSPYAAGELPEALIQTFEPHTEVAVAPLIARDRIVGVVICDNKVTKTHIGATDIESLGLFATTAAIAVENRRKLRGLFAATSTLVSPDCARPLRELVRQTLHAAQADWVKLLLAKSLDPPSFKLVEQESRGPRRPTVHVRPNGISMEVMRTGQARPIEDVAKASNANPALAEEGVAAALCLPWVLRGKALGVLWLHYMSPRRFSEQEIADLQMYVNHLAAVWGDLQQVRRMAETQKTSAALARATRLGGEQTLSSIVRATKQVLRCDTVTLYIYDATGDRLRCVVPTEGVWDGEGATQLDMADRGSLVYRLFKRGKLHVATDVSRDAFFKDSRFAKEERIRSAVAVPLTSRHAKLGILFVSYRRRSLFPREELENIRLFANHAAIAMQNAALFEGNKKQLTEKASLLSLSQGLLASVTTKQIMGCAVTSVQGFLKCDLTCIVLEDRSGDLVLRSAVGWDEKHVDALRLPHDRGSHAGFTVLAGRAVFVEDASSETSFLVPEALQGVPVVSGLGVPMVSGKTIIGAMLVHSRSRRVFTAAEADFLQLIANQAAIAITSARHADAIAAQQGRLAALQMATKVFHGSRSEEPREILRQILENAVDNLAARKGREFVLGSIQGYEEATAELIVEAFHPMRLYRAEKARCVSLREAAATEGRVGITGRVVQDRRPIRVGDVRRSEDYLAFNENILSELAVPVLDGERVVGVINVESDQLDAFDQEDEHTLVALAALAAVVWRSARRQRELTHLSHDFGRPITKIMLDVDNMRTALGQNGPGPGTMREDLTEIYGAARTLLRVHSNLLGLALIHEGATFLRTGRCDITALVDSVVTGLDWEARPKGIQVGVAAEGSFVVEIDVPKIEQVLMNLLINAIKFSHAGGRIDVHVRRDGDGVEIAVHDEGPGIAPEHQERVFERFYRVDRSPRTEGSGLGLAIAKDYVERHGGRIWVESEPGKGSTFRLRLPGPVHPVEG